jgi:short-subunit dehydrogenase
MAGKYTKHFNGKTVFLVGGSEGIGLEAAKILAGNGAHVLIFSRNKEKLERALEEIQKSRVSDSQKAAYYRLDVSDNDLVREVMKKAVAEFGVPGILINNVGRAYPGYFEDIGYEAFDQTMKVNLYGVRNTCAALIPVMKKNGGTIVNVSSMVGYMGVFGYTDYAASKFGLIGFTETLRSEYKNKGLKFHVLCPPDTATPGFEVENQSKPPECKAISESAKIRSAAFVAEALVKGMTKKKFFILPGFDNKMIFKIKRFFPKIVDMSMDGTIKKAQKK